MVDVRAGSLDELDCDFDRLDVEELAQQVLFCSAAPNISLHAEEADLCGDREVGDAQIDYLTVMGAGEDTFSISSRLEASNTALLKEQNSS